MPESHDSIPGFLPRAEHLAYLSSLVTVLAVLYGAYYIWRRDRRSRAGRVPQGPDFRWGQ